MGGIECVLSLSRMCSPEIFTDPKDKEWRKFPWELCGGGAGCGCVGEMWGGMAERGLPYFTQTELNQTNLICCVCAVYV
jgi:hypothetical protein